MIAFPASLTNKNWQKNKGLFAKAKPTGIGETLIALEKAYLSSGFALDTAKLGAETYDPLLFEKKFDQYVKTLALQAKKLDGLVGATAAKTKAAEKTFAGNKPVLAVLNTLELDLGRFMHSLGTVGTVTKTLQAEVLAAYSKHLKSNRAYAQVVGKGLAASTEKHRLQVLAEIKKLEANPEIAMIGKLWGSDGAARTLRTTPILWDQVLVKEFPQTTAAIRAGSANQTYRISLPWVEDVGDEPGGKATRKVTALADQLGEDRAITTMALEYSNSMIKYQEFCKDILKLENYMKKYSK